MTNKIPFKNRLVINICWQNYSTATHTKCLTLQFYNQTPTNLNTTTKYLSLIVLAMMVISFSQAQDFSDIDKSPMDAVMARNKDNSSLVRIIYSRPFKRNRAIFGKLVPYGEVWRTGANETTEIRFYEHSLVNGKAIKKGTYALFSIPKEDEWIIIINANYKGWGAYSYNTNEDVIRFSIPTKQTATEIEQFSVSARPLNKGTNVLMGWDDTYVEFEVVPDASLFEEEENEITENSTETEKKDDTKRKKRKKFLWIF